MPGPNIEEIDRFTKPLCSRLQYETKIANLDSISRSFSLREERCAGLPFQIHVEPSGHCNLRCPICPRGRGIIERTGFLLFESFERVFTPLSATLTTVVFSGFGEPLLSPDTTRMIALASQNSVATLLNSNGTVLEDRVDAILASRLTRINISLDGAVSESVHQYDEHWPFSKVLDGVRALCEQKHRGRHQYPFIIGQFIISDETCEEVSDLRQLALDIGIEEIRFKRMHPTMPGEMCREKLLSAYPLAEALRNKKVKSAEKLDWSQRECMHPWGSIFLSCTGQIGVCSFDPHLSHKLGDCNDDFPTLWNNTKLRAIRKWRKGNTKGTMEPCSSCNRLPGYLVPQEG